MKYLFINSIYGTRSTGKLIQKQCLDLQKQGHTCYVAYGRNAVDDGTIPLIQIGNRSDYLVHALESRILDNQGFGSVHATKVFLKAIESYDFDCIWLHNLHGYYINVELLFEWLKNHPHIKVIWTLHDCWSFTGHCVHFTVAKCDKWKTGCHHCPQKRTYPASYVCDRSRENYLRKKAAFTNMRDMTLITPSNWLADLTRNSFLKEYPVKVIHNTIDTSVFHPVSGTFRKDHHLEDCYIVLGVAIGWEETKGYPDILELRKLLDDRFVIVLVGLTQKQIKRLPEGILGIERTNNQRELVAIYSTADVLVNPTHQDNYPTVNLEAKACGTPVVTYNVGGSPESVDPENVIEEGNLEAMAKRIEALCQKPPKRDEI